MSRVDAVRLALEKAAEHGHDLGGAVLASDAFFPFPDGPQLALDAGVDRHHPARRLEARRRGRRAVDAAGGAMVFTSPPPLPALGLHYA